MRTKSEAANRVGEKENQNPSLSNTKEMRTNRPVNKKDETKRAEKQVTKPLSQYL